MGKVDLTISAEVNGKTYTDRFVCHNEDVVGFRQAWLYELKQQAGVPDEGSLVIQVSLQ